MSITPDSANTYQEFQCRFIPIAQNLNSLPQPRSIAELRLAKSDIDSIRHLFTNLQIDPRVWLADRMPRTVAHDLQVSPSEVIALLLLVIGTHACRTEGTENAVWPYIRRCIPSEFEGDVFPGGQPSADLKDAFTRITRKLRLRNAIHWQGSQEYFTTIKLQFAFTYRGARRRLAEWLVGLGEPVAIQALRGVYPDHSDVVARSFCELVPAPKRVKPR